MKTCQQCKEETNDVIEWSVYCLCRPCYLEHAVEEEKEDINKGIISPIDCEEFGNVDMYEKDNYDLL